MYLKKRLGVKPLKNLSLFMFNYGFCPRAKTIVLKTSDLELKHKSRKSSKSYAENPKVVGSAVFALCAKTEAKKQTFYNYTFDKGRLKSLVSWSLKTYGEYKTIKLLENLKKTGFEYATKAGISLGIEDLKIPPKKAALLYEAEEISKKAIDQYNRAEITGVERFQRLIDAWHRTSEQLKQEVIGYFEKTDILNPVYMMAFSGARGNISQVRQLVGMRGLMADPKGQIIDYPIRSNFREGLTLTEYIISSYGARKGIVDTALRTANAGYLTRRLVDVAQHVVISSFDCGTKKGIFLSDMKEGNKTIYSLQSRLLGRVLAREILLPADNSMLRGQNQAKQDKIPTSILQSMLRAREGLTPLHARATFLCGGVKPPTKNSKPLSDLGKQVAFRNQEITADLAFEITKYYKKVFVRSPLTCTPVGQSKKLVCQLCYGWSLAQGNLVSIGEAVGIVAAQSIGEPGTQLTMRTFHTGGVFSGDVTDQIRAPYNGFIYYCSSIYGNFSKAKNSSADGITSKDQALDLEQNTSKQKTSKTSQSTYGPLHIAGTLIRTPEGKIAFLTKTDGFVCVYNNSNPIDTAKKWKIPAYTILYYKNGQEVFEKQIIAQISTIARQQNMRDDSELTVKSEIQGQLVIQTLQIKEQLIGPKQKKKAASKSTKNKSSTLEFNPLIMDQNLASWNWGYAWILSCKFYKIPIFAFAPSGQTQSSQGAPSARIYNPNISLIPKIGDFVDQNSIMTQIQWFLPQHGGYSVYLQTRNTFSVASEQKKNSDNCLENTNPLRGVFSKTSNQKPKAKLFNSINIQKNLLFLDINQINYKKIGYFLDNPQFLVFLPNNLKGANYSFANNTNFTFVPFKHATPANIQIFPKKASGSADNNKTGLFLAKLKNSLALLKIANFLSQKKYMPMDKSNNKNGFINPTGSFCFCAFGFGAPRQNQRKNNTPEGLEITQTLNKSLPLKNGALRYAFDTKTKASVFKSFAKQKNKNGTLHNSKETAILTKKLTQIFNKIKKRFIGNSALKTQNGQGYASLFWNYCLSFVKKSKQRGYNYNYNYNNIILKQKRGKATKKNWIYALGILRAAIDLVNQKGYMDLTRIFERAKSKSSFFSTDKHRILKLCLRNYIFLNTLKSLHKQTGAVSNNKFWFLDTRASVHQNKNKIEPLELTLRVPKTHKNNNWISKQGFPLAENPKPSLRPEGAVYIFKSYTNGLKQTKNLKIVRSNKKTNKNLISSGFAIQKNAGKTKFSQKLSNRLAGNLSYAKLGKNKICQSRSGFSKTYNLLLNFKRKKRISFNFQNFGKKICMGLWPIVSEKVEFLNQTPKRAFDLNSSRIAKSTIIFVKKVCSNISNNTQNVGTYFPISETYQKFNQMQIPNTITNYKNLTSLFKKRPSLIVEKHVLPLPKPKSLQKMYLFNTHTVVWNFAWEKLNAPVASIAPPGRGFPAEREIHYTRNSKETWTYQSGLANGQKSEENLHLNTLPKHFNPASKFKNLKWYINPKPRFLPCERECAELSTYKTRPKVQVRDSQTQNQIQTHSRKSVQRFFLPSTTTLLEFTNVESNKDKKTTMQFVNPISIQIHPDFGLRVLPYFGQFKRKDLTSTDGFYQVLNMKFPRSGNYVETNLFKKVAPSGRRDLKSKNVFGKNYYISRKVKNVKPIGAKNGAQGRPKYSIFYKKNTLGFYLNKNLNWLVGYAGSLTLPCTQACKALPKPLRPGGAMLKPTNLFKNSFLNKQNVSLNPLSKTPNKTLLKVRLSPNPKNQSKNGSSAHLGAQSKPKSNSFILAFSMPNLFYGYAANIGVSDNSNKNKNKTFSFGFWGSSGAKSTAVEFGFSEAMRWGFRSAENPKVEQKMERLPDFRLANKFKNINMNVTYAYNSNFLLSKYATTTINLLNPILSNLTFNNTVWKLYYSNGLGLERNKLNNQNAGASRLALRSNKTKTNKYLYTYFGIACQKVAPSGRRDKTNNSYLKSKQTHKESKFLVLSLKTLLLGLLKQVCFEFNILFKFKNYNFGLIKQPFILGQNQKDRQQKDRQSSKILHSPSGVLSRFGYGTTARANSKDNNNNSVTQYLKFDSTKSSYTYQNYYCSDWRSAHSAQNLYFKAGLFFGFCPRSENQSCYVFAERENKANKRGGAKEINTNTRKENRKLESPVVNRTHAQKKAKTTFKVCFDNISYALTSLASTSFLSFYTGEILNGAAFGSNPWVTNKSRRVAENNLAKKPLSYNYSTLSSKSNPGTKLWHNASLSKQHLKLPNQRYKLFSAFIDQTQENKKSISFLHKQFFLNNQNQCFVLTKKDFSSFKLQDLTKDCNELSIKPMLQNSNSAAPLKFLNANKDWIQNNQYAHQRAYNLNRLLFNNKPQQSAGEAKPHENNFFEVSAERKTQHKTLQIGAFVLKGTLAQKSLNFSLRPEGAKSKAVTSGTQNPERGDKEQPCLSKFKIFTLPGQIIHLSSKDVLRNYGLQSNVKSINLKKNVSKVTIRKAQPFFVSTKTTFHAFHGDFVQSKEPVITLIYQKLKAGDIIQGIPKVEQFFEARTTKRGRLFRDNLPNLLKGLFLKYYFYYFKLLKQGFGFFTTPEGLEENFSDQLKADLSGGQNFNFISKQGFPLAKNQNPFLRPEGANNIIRPAESTSPITLDYSYIASQWAVKQSFYKIQQIAVDGVLRVYRSQGVTISDKHLEIIVKQMTTKVRILKSGQTAFFPGEIVDLDFVETLNAVLIRKIHYEPIILGITKASLQVDSFLSAASFQQTAKILSQAALTNKKDYLKGIKENVLLGNLMPAGTGYLVALEKAR